MGTTVTGTSTTVTGLTPGTQYRFRVRAKNIVGYGPFSQWSIPGTPTGGLPPSPPPPSAIQVSVSIAPLFCSENSTSDRAWCYTQLVVSATAAGTLANLAYTWQGRWWRTLLATNGLCGGFGYAPCRFNATDPNWTNISLSPVPYVAGNLYYAGVGDSQGNGMRVVWVNRDHTGTKSIAPNYWDIRVRVTGTLISDGQVVGPAEGYSRAIPFKEYFAASYDYPTDVISLP